MKGYSRLLFPSICVFLALTLACSDTSGEDPATGPISLHPEDCKRERAKMNSCFEVVTLSYLVCKPSQNSDSGSAQSRDKCEDFAQALWFGCWLRAPEACRN